MTGMIDLATHSKYTVAEFLDAYPQTIPVFLAHKMLCVGCAMAVFDTLEDAAANYAIPLTQLLDELSTQINKQQ